jgi:hypothetical protein
MQHRTSRPHPLAVYTNNYTHLQFSAWVFTLTPGEGSFLWESQTDLKGSASEADLSQRQTGGGGVKKYLNFHPPWSMSTLPPRNWTVLQLPTVATFQVINSVLSSFLHAFHFPTPLQVFPRITFQGKCLYFCLRVCFWEKHKPRPQIHDGDLHAPRWKAEGLWEIIRFSCNILQREELRSREPSISGSVNANIQTLWTVGSE